MVSDGIKIQKRPRGLKSKIPLAPRIDYARQSHGPAQYVEDLPDLPNTAYGADAIESILPRAIFSASIVPKRLKCPESWASSIGNISMASTRD